MEMDAARITKISFVGVILLILGFVVYRNWDYWSGREIDYAVTMGGPITIKTADDSHKEFEYFYADSHGKMRVRETDVDGKLKSITFTWEPMVVNAGAFAPRVTRMPVPNLSSISDPSLRLWVLNVLVNQRRDTMPSSYVILAGLNADQASKEAELRKALATQLELIDDGAKDGTRDQAGFNKVIADMEAAKANTNDPEKDAKKAQEIHAVIDDAQAYDAKMDAQRVAEAQAYVDAIQKLLNDDQRQHLDEFVKREMDVEQQQGIQALVPAINVAGRRNVNPGANGAGNGAAGNGNAGNRGNRGNGVNPAGPGRGAGPAGGAAPVAGGGA